MRGAAVHWIAVTPSPNVQCCSQEVWIAKVHRFEAHGELSRRQWFRTECASTSRYAFATSQSLYCGRSNYY